MRRKALRGKDLERAGRAAFDVSPYGATTYNTSP